MIPVLFFINNLRLYLPLGILALIAQNRPIGEEGVVFSLELSDKTVPSGHSSITAFSS